MKRSLYYFVFLFVVGLLQQSLQAVAPIVDYSVFYTNEEQAYVETYLLIPGSSVVFAGLPQQLQAKVAVTVLFKQGDTIVQFDKYQLNSKVVSDINAVNFNLIDLKRYPLPEGNYQLSLAFVDLNKPEKTAEYTTEIFIEKVVPNVVYISDISLLETYTPSTTGSLYARNGYDLIPNVAHYYPENINTLSFYAEIYGTDAYFTDVEEYLLVYSISKKGKNGRINGYKKMKKEQKNALKAVLASIDISDLTSGNYQLGVAVRNQKNELVTEKYITFQRNKKAQVQVLNDIDAIKTMDVSQTFVAQLSNDEVLYFLQAAKHRCEARGKSYIDNILKSNDSELQRRYLYNFWAGKNPHDPQEAFVAYKELIDQAERLYKTQLFHGFDSDRGRVLVQYGRPNDIMEVENEPGALPYEIWHYYQLQTVTDVGTQSNVKFVFYNPNIADNEFELLHSNARSEINDPNWEMKIYNSFKEQSGSHNFDNQNVREHYGRRARDLFDGKY